MHQSPPALSFFRRLVPVFVALALAACGDEGTPAQADAVIGADLSDATAALDQGDGGPQPPDVTDADILYAGYLCERDEECSTGICYGLSTPQGAFEPKRCQTSCLQLNDFRKYCDTDRDCCDGRCCIDCGPKEGICVPTIDLDTAN
jgi:hypothetical protein